MATVSKIQPVPVPTITRLDLSEKEAEALRNLLAETSPGVLYGVWDALDDVLRCGETVSTKQTDESGG